MSQHKGNVVGVKSTRHMSKRHFCDSNGPGEGITEKEEEEEEEGPLPNVTSHVWGGVMEWLLRGRKGDEFDVWRLDAPMSACRWMHYAGRAEIDEGRGFKELQEWRKGWRLGEQGLPLEQAELLKDALARANPGDNGLDYFKVTLSEDESSMERLTFLKRHKGQGLVLPEVLGTVRVNDGMYVQGVGAERLPYTARRMVGGAFLRFDDNMLTELPGNLEHMRAKAWLGFAGNPLKPLPEGTVFPPGTSTLDISRTPGIGVLPASLVASMGLENFLRKDPRTTSTLTLAIVKRDREAVIAQRFMY